MTTTDLKLNWFASVVLVFAGVWEDSDTIILTGIICLMLVSCTQILFDKIEVNKND